ncbi:solute carrier organic anion transporter family member 4A1-like [Lytechinus variegatus]|uniref:solute carrier organic anion transporter family member 4A1-like n=1 Tax=Lytechinus variegatus TaxID=7654 RepID=UPI001BB220FC|nr:solute carrier organic anion transporter family member 4A1-like [Lytechinus variegatus]XP_041479914.1 solute carrier organic anion transporter family member 4A1-like [Lytechinus variegatus]
MSSPDPVYHTLQPPDDVNEESNELEVGLDDQEDDHGIDGDMTSRIRSSNGCSTDLPTRIVENPPPYEPTHQDNLLSYDGSFPMASMSRDAYGMDDDEDFDDDDEKNPPKCGWGRFTPSCMSVCMNVKAYLLVYSLIGIIQVMTSYGMVSIAVTTIEKRFQLTSFQSGIILSAYQFASMTFTIFITYIGEQRHKPRWVGVGSLFLALGSIIFTLPHFLSDFYNPEDHTGDGSINPGVCPMVNLSMGVTNGKLDICDSGNTTEIGGESGEDPSRFLWFFILAQICNSLAAAPVFTLGLTYMDDNLSSKTFGLYMGIFNGIMSFGPAAGYFIGSITLSLHTNFYADLSSVTITPDNPLWVGAWWLGFLISASLVALSAFIIMAFPKALPGMKKKQREKRRQGNKGSEFVVRSGLGNSIRDAPRALVKILSNAPFLFLALEAATDYFIGTGIFIFTPKFVESQFNMNARDVARYLGIMVMTQHFLGSIVSGALIKKFDLKFEGLLKLSICSIICSLLLGLSFLMHCPNPPLAGITVEYQTSIPISSDEISLISPCNSHCTCPDYFEPACGEDNVMYFSPCHAGCTEDEYVDDDGKKIYTDCRCIVLNNDTFISTYDDVTTDRRDPYGGVKPGRCRTSCNLQWLFLALLWFFAFFGTMTSIPAWIATLRSVSYSQRAFALGVQSLFYGGLGTVPAPIVFGLIIDQACIKWDESNCSGSGACLVYDNQAFSKYFLILALCFKSASLGLLVLSRSCYTPTEEKLDARDVYAGRSRPRLPTTEL